MNKDKELREILGECGLDAPDEEEIQKAMGLIKALYKPLEKDYKEGRETWESIIKGYRSKILAIINARGVGDA